MKKVVLLFSTALLTSTVYAKESTAYKVTVLSLDKDVKSNSVEVQRTQDALTRATTVCKENEGAIGEIVWYVTKEIRNKDVRAEATEILEGVNAVLLGVKDKQPCSETMAFYATNRMSGSTHSDTVAGMRGLYRTMGLVD